MMRTLALAVLLFPVALPAEAAIDDAPPPAPPRPFALPHPDTITLENGIQVTFLEYGRVPKVTLAAVVRTGHIDQGTRIWLPDLVGDLLKEGTSQRSATEIADQAARMGGALSVSVGDDQTTISMDVLEEHGAEAARLVAEVLTRPLLPATELPRIRQDYLRNLAVLLSEAQALADIAFAGLVYGEHPYGAGVPSESQLESYTIDDVRRFHEENFSAARTRLYVAGRFDRTALETALQDTLGHWQRGAAPTIMPPSPGSVPRVKLVDRPDAPQATIRLGLPVIDPSQPDFMALSVANTLLGGAVASRITLNIREDKGWAYSPVSSLEVRYRDGLWTEDADVQTGETGPALAEIYREIERLRSGPPGETELTAIKNYRNGIFVLSNVSRFGLIGQLSFMDLHGLPYEWLTTWLDRMYAVTPAEVTAVVRRYLDPSRMSLVVVGDLEQIRPQLEQVEQISRLPFE